MEHQISLVLNTKFILTISLLRTYFIYSLPKLFHERKYTGLSFISYCKLFFKSTIFSKVRLAPGDFFVFQKVKKKIRKIAKDFAHLIRSNNIKDFSFASQLLQLYFGLYLSRYSRVVAPISKNSHTERW